MSPINFDTLQADRPDLGAVWADLRAWYSANGRRRFVATADLARSLKGRVDPMALVLAMAEMADHGMVTEAFRVRGPDGHLLEGDFETPLDIPAELPTRDYSHTVQTCDGDIVTGYRWQPADAT